MNSDVVGESPGFDDASRFEQHHGRENSFQDAGDGLCLHEPHAVLAVAGDAVGVQVPVAGLAPSLLEYEEALLLGDIDSMSSLTCLRGLLKQNNLMIRHFAWCQSQALLYRDTRMSAPSGVYSGSVRSSLASISSGIDQLNMSGSTSSGGSALEPAMNQVNSLASISSGTTQLNVTGSCASGGSAQQAAMTQVNASGSSSSSGSVQKKAKISPPKCFFCPICRQYYNEKDMSRHIKDWIDKCDDVGPVRADGCPGVRDVNHPLLQQFPFGTKKERVCLLVRDLRSFMHPGAYDSLNNEGSGRHIDLSARFHQLLGRQGGSAHAS